MKSSTKHSSPSFLFFRTMPSCSMLKAYKLKCEMLNRAIRDHKPVQVVSKNNMSITLKEVGKDTRKYFGYVGFKGKMKKILLNINEINKVILL